MDFGIADSVGPTRLNPNEEGRHVVTAVPTTRSRRRQIRATLSGLMGATAEISASKSLPLSRKYLPGRFTMESLLLSLPCTSFHWQQLVGNWFSLTPLSVHAHVKHLTNHWGRNAGLVSIAEQALLILSCYFNVQPRIVKENRSVQWRQFPRTWTLPSTNG